MPLTPKIALYSFDPFPGDPEGNASRMAHVMEEARRRSVDLLVFPEMSLPGYCIGDLHRSSSFVRRQHDALHDVLIPASRSLAVIVGLTLEEDGRLYNGFAVLQDGRLVRTGRKTLLINDGVLEDSRFFRPGSPEEIRPVELTLAGRTVSLGVMVCQDMWSDGEDVNPSMILRQRGAEALIVINASPFYVGKTHDRHEVASRRVTETGLPLYYVNATGLQDIGKNLVIFDGEAFAIAPKESFFKERFIESSLDLPLTTAATVVRSTPEVPEQPRELYSALSHALSWFSQRTSVFEGAVIGLSGGIDSAVDAALAAKAFGPDRLLCVNMPSRYNSSTTRDIAHRIADGLDCRYVVHPIQEIADLRISLLTHSLGHEPKPLTQENIQARIRGSILMEYSQELGYMVIGNGNKTEFQRGYATLYGDILGAIMPLGDVDKVSVFELARYMMNELAIPFPEELFTLPPSAELSEAQDVDQGRGDPFDYYVEAPAGRELVEYRRTPEEIASMFESMSLNPEIWKPDPRGRTVYEKFSTETFHEYIVKVAAAIRRSYFKRVQAPPIPVVTRRSFGLDLRESLFPHDMY